MENVTVIARSPKTEVSATLIIKDFLEELARPSGEFLESHDFMVKETPIRMRVYPNGYNEACRGYVSVGLANMGNGSVKVKYQFSTDIKTSVMVEHTLAVNGQRSTGVSDFLTHAECQEFFKERDFVLKIQVEMEGEQVKMAGEVPASRQLKSIYQEIGEKAFQGMEWADFILEFEGEEVACHKVILAGASPVLGAMVRNELQEAAKGKAAIKLSAVVGKAFVRFMYLEEVEEDLLKREVVAFLELGEKYQVERLKEFAEDWMLKSLNKDNMVDFLVAADTFRARRIKAAALRLAMANKDWLRGEGKEELRKITQDLFIELI